LTLRRPASARNVQDPSPDGFKCAFRTELGPALETNSWRFHEEPKPVLFYASGVGIMMNATLPKSSWPQRCGVWQLTGARKGVQPDECAQLAASVNPVIPNE
jgi:hypothetical protein